MDPTTVEASSLSTRAGEVQEWKRILDVLPESGVLICNRPASKWDNIDKKLLQPGSEIAEFFANGDDTATIKTPSERDGSSRRVLLHQTASGTVVVNIGG
jgi:hypothetical protein